MKSIWISHRGYCEKATENTRAAFDAAIKLGFEHLETDLRTTSDGHIVLHHDPDLKKTCGSDLVIAKSTLAELQTIKTLDGRPIMTLAELLRDFETFNWTFDIKPQTEVETLHELARWIKGSRSQAWFERRVRFLTWSKRGENLARDLFPKVTTLARETECYRAGFAALLRLGFLGSIKAGRTYSLPSHFAGCHLFTKVILDAYRSRGARLIAYLPESNEEAKIAYFLGFDEILTNGKKLF